jgi:preprotein translocase subunit SecE
VSQTRSNAGEELDGVADGDEELEDAVVETKKPSRAERKAAKRRAKRDGASTSASRGPRRKRTSPALFIRQIIAELRKVVWPTRGELGTYTGVVIVFCVAVIGFVALIDYGVTHAVSAVFG